MPEINAPSKHAPAENFLWNGSSKNIIIPSETAQAKLVHDAIQKSLQATDFGEKEIYGIRLAVEEALVNAIKHGNRMNPTKVVEVRYQISTARFDVHVRDQGDGYDPDDLPDPLSPENLERACGRGLMLMRYYMSEVIVHPPGNAVTMTKHRGEAEED